MRSRSVLTALLGLVLLAALAPTAASAGPATPTATLQLELGSCGISGEATNVSLNQLTIKHRSASGTLKRTVLANTSGGVFSVGCPGKAVRSGDRLQLFQGTSTAPFRTFKVPTMTLTTDRVQDTLRGTVTGGVSTVGVLVSVCDPALFGCTGYPPFNAPVDPDTRRFSVGAGQDLAGNWTVELEWTKGGDRVVLEQGVGRLVVQPGSSTVLGTGRTAGQSVSVSVRRGQKVGTATPTTRSNADFTARIKRGGSPMTVKAGDLVSASFAGNAAMTVPASSISYDGGASEADGRCFKNAPVRVLLTDFIGGLQAWGSTTSSSTGDWTVPIGPVSAGWTVTAWCGNARGDAIKLQILLN